MEVIGLSFLDMICCAFGGVLVLYLLANNAKGSSDPVPAAFLVVEATIESNLPFDIGMQFESGGTQITCFRRACPDAANGSLQWLRASGSIAAILRSQAAQPRVIQVALLRGTGLTDRACVEVVVNSGTQTVLALRRENGFRGRVALPAGNDRCANP